MNKNKIEKMVNKYNKFASKYGYDTITIDYERKEIIGSFIAKDENQYKGFIGFFKNMNIAGNNASLKADYDRIEKEIKKGGD